jgi:tight adherence protein B
VSTTAILCSALGAAALFIGLVLALLPTGRSELRRLETLEQRIDPLPTPQQAGSPLDRLRRGLQRSVGSRFERTDRAGQLADRLARADLKLRPAEWILVSLGATAAVAVLALLRFGSPIAALIGAVVGYVGAQAVLPIRASRRAKAFDAQLSPAMLAISGAMKAGYTFAQAVDLAAKNSPNPIGAELARLTREVQLGIPMNDAFVRMVKRNESEDLRLMLVAVQIQSQVGGNLAQIIDTIEFTVRERVRIRGEIKTLTSQARASGYVLLALPFALGGILMVIAPTYFSPMVHKLPGQIMLGMAAFMMACGYGIIRKITAIKV